MAASASRRQVGFDDGEREAWVQWNRFVEATEFFLAGFGHERAQAQSQVARDERPTWLAPERAGQQEQADECRSFARRTDRRLPLTGPPRSVRHRR